MNLAIITSRYPSVNNPYNHMFVHVRSLYFKEKAVNVTVFVPSKVYNSYEYQGIQVVCDTSVNINKHIGNYDLAYLHLLNLYPLVDGGLSIYNKIRKSKIPVAIYLHGTEVLTKSHHYFYSKLFSEALPKTLYNKFWKQTFMNFFLKRIIRNNKHIILTPSYWMKEEVEKIYKLKFPKFEVIPNGIDTEFFNSSGGYNKCYKIITIRPLNEKKYAVDRCIEIMRYLPENYSLDIYGKGLLMNKYQKLIKYYKLENRVRIIPKFIERNNIKELFKEYGVFFAFSRIDAQGVMMCEAMSSGLLTITNNNSALPEFVQNMKTGLIGNNLKDIAINIEKVSQDKSLYDEITKKARKSMEKIDWQIVGERELETLKSL